MKKQIENEFTKYFAAKYPAKTRKTSWHFLNFVSEKQGLTGDAKRDNTLKMSYRFKEWCAREGFSRSWESAMMWYSLAGKDKRR